MFYQLVQPLVSFASALVVCLAPSYEMVMWLCFSGCLLYCKHHTYYLKWKRTKSPSILL